MHELEELEQVILTVLEPLKAQGIKTLELYAGQVDSDGMKELAKTTAKFPCIYVLAAGFSLVNKIKYDEEDIMVMLIIGERNLRGSDAAKLGDANSLGVYDILELTESKLHRKKIHESGSMRLTGSAPLFLAPKKGICFYSAKYLFETIKS